MVTAPPQMHVTTHAYRIYACVHIEYAHIAIESIKKEDQLWRTEIQWILVSDVVLEDISPL